MTPLARSSYSRFVSLVLGGFFMGALGCGGNTYPMDGAERAEALDSASPSEFLSTQEAVGSDYALARVDWLEPAVLTTDTPGFALVSGRAVKVRAFVTAPETGAPAPQVQIKVLDAQQRVLADSTMTSPVAATVGTQPTLGSLSEAYLFELQAEWVQPGLQVDLTVNSGPSGLDPNPDNNHLLLTPAVDPPNVLYITVVPVQTQAEGLARLPEEENGPEATRAALKSLLMASYPLSDVKVRIHEPYMAKVPSQLGNWGNLLGEIKDLRIAEGRHGYYLGFIKPAGGTTVGNSFMPGTVAIVSAGNPWRKGTVMHEMGHNFGRGHVDCGAMDSSGQNWGYNAESGQMIDPTRTSNIMSYCSPGWVSHASYLSILKRFRDRRLDWPTDPDDWQ
ncbi:hypothetical protein POL68_32750 [Stigmatella sp. ncwal1]|uniref:Uncharacterized protein n=1 Tax=Stigmatella ashevillensis TaxID=2995309 RepID=A0ABT5DJG4_9BACT|nr:hypothetical protein [Stigmatella ashevillena]MDC0713278.1 hypothetical protein [Stigmatella ashevillena]